MSDNETPEWYDESRVRKAIFAFERGRSAYTGWVVDLGDGTCRLANAPLLGPDGPEWGDRVDLFYHPCSPFDMPMIGYRIYQDGEEPVGRHFGLHREPSEEDIEDNRRREEAEERRELALVENSCAALEARAEADRANIALSKEILHYYKLKDWVESQGLVVPADLHEKTEEPREKTLQERKDTKLFLLSTAEVDYGDIEVSSEEIADAIKKHREEDAQAAAIVKAFKRDSDV